MGQCNYCQRIVLVDVSHNEIYPHPLPGPVDSRITEAIRRDYKEAKECLSISAFRAAAIMARRAIQSICLDKGATPGDKLQQQIDWLFDQRIITKELQDWAHEVRLVGNDAAHPSKPSEDVAVSEQDAEEILELLDQFCQVLYVVPIIAQARRDSRANKN